LEELKMQTNQKKTDLIRKRYNRLAFFYNAIEIPMELFRFGTWRNLLKKHIIGPEVLEVGVGTGKNMPYYPPDVSVTAIDFSPRMLARAETASLKKGINVELREMDVENLEFPDNSFDTVFATFVFCSVPDPVNGLMELKRVCKPDGRLILLEHMRPEASIRGFLFDLINPFVVRVMGANINRRTMENIRTAGWKVRVEKRLAYDIVRWIEAVP
jgi:ubiquinone/menaquinone biosynthesis C-methylase UbiE